MADKTGAAGLNRAGQPASWFFLPAMQSRRRGNDNPIT